MATTQRYADGDPKAAGGFTLIELLVVIAIISILMSILMPAMNGARRQSRTTLCATHLNHVGKAFQIYLAENNAVYPPSYIYPKTADGQYDFEEQPTDHPYGYMHWSWFLYENGSVKDEAFTCPEFLRGGAPRTNPGENSADWESGQVDQNSQSSPNSLVDKQAARIAYVTNAAVVPRNKFTKEMVPGKPRRNVFVSENAISDPRAVILAAELNKSWRVSAVAQGSANACLSKSHRPVSAFYSISSGTDEYAAPPTGGFRYGVPNTKDYGLLPSTVIDQMVGVIENGAGGPEVNAVGRHHPGGDRLGGTTNFLYVDGHVGRTTILQTMYERQWGAKFYSLSGPNTEIKGDQ